MSGGKTEGGSLALGREHFGLFYTLIEAEPITGRTHQIRVHLSNAGNPVFGDPEYAGRNRQLGRLTSGQRKQVAVYFEKVSRQMLHACTLGFIHPVTRRELFFETELPEDFTWLLEELRGSV